MRGNRCRANVNSDAIGGLDKARTDRFVGMYVNGLTLDYGDRGRQAVTRLLGDAVAAGLLPLEAVGDVCAP